MPLVPLFPTSANFGFFILKMGAVPALLWEAHPYTHKYQCPHLGLLLTLTLGTPEGPAPAQKGPHVPETPQRPPGPLEHGPHRSYREARL